MADVTPGPGWWRASDGEWYPPRWEYRWVRAWLGAKPHLDNVETILAELGRQGWEAVSIQGGASISSEAVAVLMKRPIVG